MPDAVYVDALRLAIDAARRGRYCGGRGRRASWGSPSDNGGIVPLPVPRDSGDDDEAAIDAIGIAWARASAGRYGAPGDAFPVGRLYTLARNLGRLRAVRRIREHGTLTGAATDRTMPADAVELTRAQLLALVPPERRGAAIRALDSDTGGEAARRRRQRMPAEDRSPSRLALLAQKSDAFDAAQP